jgi:hypothetical protein
MAVIGILIAATVIVAVTLAPLPPGSTTSTVTSRVTSTSTTISTTTKVSYSTSTTPEGTMATQVADFLSLPPGVTSVYLQYSDIEVQTSISGSSLWIRVAPGEDLNLINLSNNGVTVADASVPSGTYDAARFTIDSAVVTFEGVNVTAIVPQAEVSVPILQNGINLRPNATSGLLFDIAPSIVPTQSVNGTGIELLTYAEALQIPTSVPSSQYFPVGSVLPLNSQSWFTSTQVNLPDNLTVLAALITSNALLVVVKNTGNATVQINGLSILAPYSSTSNLETKTVVTTLTTVTTLTEYIQNSSDPKSPAHDSSHSIDYRASKALAASQLSTNSSTLSNFQTVASFFVLYDGEVVQSSTGVNAQQLGLELSPGQNASLTFIGSIQTLNSQSSPSTPLQIISGSQYLLEVQGPFGQSENINITAISAF